MSTVSHGHSASSPPKPPRRTLPRSPSDPVRISGQDDDGQEPPAPQQIYVLSADGSRLFLLDPSKPANEEPPPYAPFHPSPSSGHISSRSLSSTNVRNAEPGPSSPHRIIQGLISPQRQGQAGLMPLPDEDHLSRHRASTLSALGHSGPARSRQHAISTRPPIRSAASSPGMSHRARIPDESTPLLADEHEVEVQSLTRGRGTWRSIFCGDVDEGDETTTWGMGWRCYWRPWSRKRYWKAAFHLIVLNFPFALLVWPWLVVGTLAGTALLITLPIGAAVWWITLFLSRSSARLETIMQLRYHSPIDPSVPEPTYHPIFYRIKERPTPPISPIDEFPPETLWETRFVKCSYAMFADHYSYSALSYFLLIKPLITLFSTIIVVALFPVCLALFFLMPIYLRVIRRWGRWQAGIAIGNL